MIRIFFFVISIFAAQHAVGQSEQIVSEAYAGTNIKLVVPQGYCAIKRDDPLGAIHYQYQEDGNKERNIVALLFADCKEWAKRVADNSFRLKHHGSYLFQLKQKQEQLLPISITLGRFLSDLSASALKADGITSEISNAKMTEIIKKKFENSAISGPTLNSPLNLGLIDKNDEAVFLGLGLTVKYPDETPRINAVTAMTMIKQVPVSINLYSDHNSKENFNKLLSMQKAAARRLHEINQY
jgi:hypothetical protein